MDEAIAGKYDETTWYLWSMKEYIISSLILHKNHITDNKNIN
jgi:hypothetical protein